MEVNQYYPVETKKTENGITVHKVNTGKEQLEIFPYFSIRAGLNWPVIEGTLSCPGYYCILGEQYKDEVRFEGKEDLRGNLIFFKEYESPNLFLDRFFQQLTDDCTLYHCDKLYAEEINLNEKHEHYAEAFRDYASRNETRHGYLVDAPYQNDFLVRVNLIQRWIGDGLLKLPQNTIVYQQLKSMSEESLGDSPRIKFYAVNALGFALGGFHKTRGPSLSGFIPDRTRRGWV